ncbi:succinylglutamate desuccinylase/aspartoacylase family protein [Asticcacaulis sp.]|uniref:succinylglutamate desuccinylase/aspartoacylase family protein n=1 Tax=Asticcacaulis sp. TaxID=1872648 RepID=UPI002602EA01|nr:succinylglutamate desuccinylase/aspartoacylase family protein [Asticcacaulis sp.]
MRTRLFSLAALALLTLATPLSAATTYTGDRIDGVKVVDRLEVADLPTGKTRLWFRVLDTSIGQGWYIPIVVIKGAKPGPKLLITAGIHGDELNGIAVIHTLAETLNPDSLSGTIVAIPGLNTPGLLHSTRGFTSDVIGTGGDNLNRLMPHVPHPDEATGSPATRYDQRIWTQLFVGNADFAVDLHTQSRGTTYPAYIFAQTGEARKIADALKPDVINMDPGVDGAIENMLNAIGVPAVTYELGAPETFDEPMIARTVSGLRNLMITRGMLAGKAEAPGKPFVGNAIGNVKSPKGGWARLKVKLGDWVTAGQALFTVHNPFGDTVATVNAPRAGQVLSLATDPRIEPGDWVVRLMWWDDTLPCKADGCPPGSFPEE